MSRETFVPPSGLPHGWPESKNERVSNRVGRSPLWVWRNLRWFIVALVPLLFSVVALYEARTSAIEARLLSDLATRLSYSIRQGPTRAIAFPSAGPLNEARGYSDLPSFERHLTNAGFHVAEQARQSRGLEDLTRWAIAPPY